ncbi:MAG: hypothetical protein ACI91O_000317 [Candidatus Poriferisodalaceae bacterium]|jgi:hypothetical protein
MSALAVVGWDPTLTGYLAVFMAVLILGGSTFLLLATNLGARLGFLVTWTSLWSWMFLMGLIWWVFAIGWVGPDPGWNVLASTTDVRTVQIEQVQELESFDPFAGGSIPGGWSEFVDADAQSAADSFIVCTDGADNRLLDVVNPCAFGAASEYATLRVMTQGGEHYRPLGIPENAITDFLIPSRSEPRYAVVQVQAYVPQAEVDPNNVVIEAQKLDPNALVRSVVMVRDQGSRRLRPALLAIFSGLLFALGCYHLHRRDQAVWAVREAVDAA